MAFTTIAALCIIAIIVIAVNLPESTPSEHELEETWRNEAMAYIDDLISIYDDKPDVVEVEQVSSDYRYYRIYLYSNKSLSRLKRYIENSRHMIDYTGADFGASPISDTYIYVDERLVSDKTDFFYYAQNETICFIFDEADAFEFQEYLIEIINTTDSSEVVRMIENDFSGAASNKGRAGEEYSAAIANGRGGITKNSSGLSGGVNIATNGSASFGGENLVVNSTTFSGVGDIAANSSALLGEENIKANGSTLFHAESIAVESYVSSAEQKMNLFPSPPSDVYVYVDEHLWQHSAANP
jgi:hypothetical protein